MRTAESRNTHEVRETNEMLLASPFFPHSPLFCFLIRLTKREAAKFLTPPFLVSKRVILFSIPVWVEGGGGKQLSSASYKRSHALTHANTRNVCQGNCWPKKINTTGPAVETYFRVFPSSCFLSDLIPRCLEIQA